MVSWQLARPGSQQPALQCGGADGQDISGHMETPPSPTFATLLQRYRQAAGLSQEELAARARLGVRTVGDLDHAEE